jgi:hypothetical protein
VLDRSLSAGIGLACRFRLLPGVKGVAGKHDDQLGRQDDADQRADGRIFERTGLHLGEVDVEHHDDEQEQHRHRADIDDQQDHRQEFGAE